VNPDIVRWNEKYRAASDSAPAEPDELLVENQALLNRNALILDLACGAGANAIFAAQRGCRVVGVDASLEGLRIAARRARESAVTLSLLNADLESWRPPPNRFDLVMVFRYLDRALLPSLRLAIRPGGVVIYKTFNRNFLEHKPEMNPDYLLAPGELARCFGTFDEIATNDGAANREVFSWWIGTRPAPRS
jgi:SAM-dependent methyltransferase